MSDVDSAIEVQTMELPVPEKASSAARKTKSKTKPKRLSDVSVLLAKWKPSDPKFTRRVLANEIRTMAEEEKFKCINSCIPALIINGTYPIDIMHYSSEKDIAEFLSRMLWMHQVFYSAIGIMVEVPDKETSDKILEACGSLLDMEDDCVVILH